MVWSLLAPSEDVCRLFHDLLLGLLAAFVPLVLLPRALSLRRTLCFSEDLLLWLPLCAFYTLGCALFLLVADHHVSRHMLDILKYNHTSQDLLW